MRLLAALSLAFGSLVLVPTPAAEAYAPLISPIPGSGPVGTEVTVIGSGFLHGVPVEIHRGSKSGSLLGTGTSSGGGLFGVHITIPAGTPLGPFTIYACGSCASEFFDEAVTTFTVTIPATHATTTTTSTTSTTTTTTTTTTVPPPPDDDGDDGTVTQPPPPPATAVVGGAACDIPDTAIIVDFDSWNRSLGDSEDPAGALQQAVLADRHPLYLRQWDAYEIRFDPPDAEHPNVLHAPRTDSIAFVTDDPAGDLWTTSPPNVLRLVGDTHWALQAGAGRLQSQLDYFGFVVGFGHFPDGFTVLEGENSVAMRDGWDHFDTPDEVVVELRIGTMPLEYVDGRVVEQGAWETVTLTLGPGPQPVTHCIIATNTLGDLDPKTVYVVDILARTADGQPLDIALDIDDMFYGYHGVGVPMPALEFVDEPATARPVATNAPATVAPDSSGGSTTWVPIAVGVVVLLGGLTAWAVRRVPRKPVDPAPTN